MNAPRVVILMAGSGERFRREGYREIKPLLDVAGKPAVARLIERFPPSWRFVFICDEAHLRATELRRVLLECAPSAEIVGIKGHKEGPVRTLLDGAAAIGDGDPVLVNYCDFSFDWDPGDFLDFAERTACEGAIFCYRGFHPHCLGANMYAYCRESGGRILEVREKACFTSDRTQEYASSGTYYFASGKLAKQYCSRAVAEGLSTQGEFFVSMAYNPMIQDGRPVRIYELAHFLQWGTPADLEDYVYWHRAFEAAALAHARNGRPGPRLVLPMAGKGSRFAAFPDPKPLIEVAGRPMFARAVERLPRGSRPPVMICRNSIRPRVASAAPGAELIGLDAETEGEAATVAAALGVLAPDEAVLVSACDHGLVWDQGRWEALLAQGPDKVVVGQRGYPGARRTPASFSFFEADSGGRVRTVSVKKPLGPEPWKDLLLTGTIYFKTARLLGELVGRLLRDGPKVNGEFQIDSLPGLALERGMDVRAFESEAYLNWGSPEALAEYSYWHGYFTGTRPPVAA